MKLTELEFDEKAVIALGRKAGAMALEYFGRVRPERKKDSTLVTAADRAVEQLVRDCLHELTPDWQVLGEEAGLGGREDNGAATWVIDPVDGTSAFATRLPIWCVSLGLIHRGRSVWGMVYCPMADELIHAGLDGRVYRNGVRFEPEEPEPVDSESVLYVPSDVHRGFRIDFPGKVRSLGSAAYHGVLAGRSGTAGVLQGRVYLWDVAGILAINRSWGMRIAHLDGRAVTANCWEADRSIPEPVLFCRPEHFEYLAERIEYVPERG